MDKIPKNRTVQKRVLIIVVASIVAVACIITYFIKDIRHFKGNNIEKSKGTAYTYADSDNKNKTNRNHGDYSDSKVVNPRKIEKGEGLEKHNIDRNNKGFKKVPNCNEKSEGPIVDLAKEFNKNPGEAKKKYKGETVRIESSTYKVSGNRNFILLNPNTGNPEIDKVQFTCYVSPGDKELVESMEKAEPVYVEGRIGYVGKLTGYDIDATDFGYIE